MPTAVRKDPYGIAHFQVEIDGMNELGFLEVSGLEGRVEVEEYREGGDLGVHKAPGNVSYSNVVVQPRHDQLEGAVGVVGQGARRGSRSAEHVDRVAR